MTKKRPFKEEDDPDNRIRYEEAALESLEWQVAEKEELARSLRKEVYARRMPRSVKELEANKVRHPRLLRRLDSCSGARSH